MSALVSAALCAAMCITIGGMAAATPARAQTTPTASATNAKIHGHAQDPLSQPVTNTKVELTTNGKTPLYTFTTDGEGNYTGSGIKPSTYTVLLYGNIQDKNGKPTQGIIDYQRDVRFAASADVQVDFDMSTKAFISKLPPEEQKKIAKVRKENAAAEQQNSKIKNVNKLIQEARADRKAKNFDQAIALDTQATQAKPDVGLTWYELGSSDLDAKKYDDAIANFKKALMILSAATKPDLGIVAAANNNLGEALAQSGKVNDAIGAYEAAAKADPTQAGMYYANEAIVLFKTGQGDPAGAAADKAIAADPNNAIPYYIKGWSLVQHATVDPKTNKIVLPPGCAEAYQKFLSLAPNNSLAADARSILAQSGQKEQKSFRKR